MEISCVTPATNSTTCLHGAADAFAGVARLACGELSAGAPLIVIGKPPSTSPKIMNIADQASRLTWLDPRPPLAYLPSAGNAEGNEPDPSGVSRR